MRPLVLVPGGSAASWKAFETMSTKRYYSFGRCTSVAILMEENSGNGLCTAVQNCADMVASTINYMA